MNNFARLAPTRRLRELRFACWMVFLPIGFLAWEGSPAQAATNVFKEWPKFTDVRKKWDDQSVQAVRQAAEKGEVTAQHYLGFCYAHGERVEADGATAIAWYQRAGDAGYMPSFDHLGLLYDEGRVVSNDLAKAIAYFGQAAAGGLDQAHIHLGLARAAYGCRFEVPPFSTDPHARKPMDMPEAVRWYRLSAELGCSRGQHHLGLCYRRGKGVEKDEEKALELFRAAVDQGDSESLYELAKLYARGVGEPRSPMDRPLELLKRATTSTPKDFAGVTKWAYDEIVLRYQYGLGTDADLVMAVEWYCQAALGGIWEYSLDGKTEPKPKRLSTEKGGTFRGSEDYEPIDIRLADAGDASEEFRQVLSDYLLATKLSPTALAEIGKRYLTGRGVSKNPMNAWCWLTLAAQHGNPEVRPLIAGIEAHLAPVELEEARRTLPKLIQRLSEASRTLGESSSERRR